LECQDAINLYYGRQKTQKLQGLVSDAQTWAICKIICEIMFLWYETMYLQLLLALMFALMFDLMQEQHMSMSFQGKR